MILFLISCAIFQNNIVGSSIKEVIPTTNQGEFFVVTNEIKMTWQGGIYDSQANVLRCFNEIKKESQETFCFSVFDTTDALDMAIEKDGGESEIYHERKR